MKRILFNILFASSALLLTQCFEEKEKIVKVIPTEQIEEKLRELRDLQREVNDEDVQSTNLQARIDQLIDELNDIIPVNNVPLTYSIGIISAGFENQLGISGAQVRINVRDQVLTATSDGSGQVRFDNLRSGVATVHISHPEYSDVNFVVDLLVNQAATDSENKGGPYNVTSTIGLYPTVAARGAFVQTGRMFFDPDRTNDILQATDPGYGRIGFFDVNYDRNDGPFAPAPRQTFVNNVQTGTVLPFIDARVQSWQALDRQVQFFVSAVPNPQDFGYVPVGTEGNIVLAVYEDMFVQATSTATGTFSVTLPHGRVGLLYRYRFAEFTGIERYNRAQNTNNTVVPAVVSTTSRERQVIFTPFYVEAGQDDLFYPGVINGFNQAQVNNINLNFTGGFESYRSLPLNIYYSAKTRDE